jgi:ABC-type nitrate/sulfonate/bicarbonate transport system permease component
MFRSENDKLNSLLDKADDNIIDIGDQRPKRIIKAVAIFAAGIIFTILIWAAVAWWYNTYMMKYVAFPDPWSTFSQLNDFFITNHKILGQTIYRHLQASLLRWAEGFIVAFAIGLAIGLFLGAYPKYYDFGIVPINVLQMIPGLAWFPVTILLFGFGEKAAIFIIAITVISPIAISVSNGLRRVPRVNLRVAKMSGRTPFEIFTEVLIPFAALDIISGVRIGMANAWRMLISAEMVVGVAVGLGYAIEITTGYLDYVSAFACVVLICIIGLLIDKVVLANLEEYARRKLGMEGS